MSLETGRRVGGAGGPWRCARGPGPGLDYWGRSGALGCQRAARRVPAATGGSRSLSLMRVPFAAMSCVASLSLVRAPSRATTSMHRAPRAVCSAPDALVDRGASVASAQRWSRAAPVISKAVLRSTCRQTGRRGGEPRWLRAQLVECQHGEARQAPLADSPGQVRCEHPFRGPL